MCEFVRVELDLKNIFSSQVLMDEEKMVLTAGLMNPTVLLPAARRASLTAAMTAANMGAEADVPPEWTKPPPSAMTNGHLADTRQ
jgi:hypothetical protein